MNKIKFDHKSETISGALGITPAREKELDKAVLESIFSNFVEDHPTISKSLEKALSVAKNEGELAYLVWHYHGARSRVVEIQEMLADKLSSKRKQAPQSDLIDELLSRAPKGTKSVN